MTDQPVEPQGAMQARRDQVAGAPRPKQLVDRDTTIQEEVRGVRDTADTWKVYVQEWVVVHRAESFLAGQAHFEGRYEGRVEPEDVRWVNTDYSPVDPAENPDYAVLLQLRLWNQRGEWKTRPLADLQATDLGVSEDLAIRIVGRNSREETLLKDYSIKRLVTVTGELRAKG